MSSDVQIDFTIEDLSPKVKEEFDKAINRSLYAAGITVQKGATNSISGFYSNGNKAVDTGRLRASISFITPDDVSPANPEVENSKESDRLNGHSEEKTMIFGSNVEYATYVHEGARGVPGRPFLREGLDMTKDEIKEKINKIFKGEL